MSNRNQHILKLPDTLTPEQLERTFAIAERGVQEGTLAAIGLPRFDPERLDQFSFLRNSSAPLIPNLTATLEDQQASFLAAKAIIERLKNPHGAIVSKGPAEARNNLARFLSDWKRQGERFNIIGKYTGHHHDNPSAAIELTDQQLQAGYGALAVPASRFLLGHFSRHLLAFHGSDLRHRGSLIVGVPYITSSANLRSWYAKGGVNIGENKYAGQQVEQWERAERDHRALRRFRIDWNIAQMNWCDSIIASGGIQFMPISHVGEALYAFREMVNASTSPRGKDFLLDARFYNSQFMQAMMEIGSGLQARLDSVILSSHLLPNKQAYADQCVPLLPAVIEAFKIAHRADPHNKFWEGLIVHVERPVLTNIARGLATARGIYQSEEDFLSDAPSSHMAVVNLRAAATKGPDDLAMPLAQSIATLADGASSTFERVEIKPRYKAQGIPLETDSALNQIGLEGYLVLRDAAQTQTIRLASAKNKQANALFDSGNKIITLCADSIVRCLINSKVEKPVLLEPGSYEANGVPELVAELHRRAQTDAALANRLKNLTIVFSDFQQPALDTSRERLGECDQATGITFEYMLLDSTKDPTDSYRDNGYAGRVIGGRAINLLDAVGSNYIARIEGEYYKVAARTYLNVSRLKDILQAEYIDSAQDEEVRFTYQQYKIDVERITSILNSDQDAARVDLFLKYTDSLGIPKNRALFLWTEIYNALEQRHDFVKTSIKDYPWVTDTEGNSLSHIFQEVLDSHPGDFMIPDSARPLEILRGLLPLMERNSEFTTLQLTTSIIDSQANFHGWRAYGVTFAMPVVYDLVHAWADAVGLVCRRTFGEKFGRTSTNSMITFKKR